MKLPGPGGLRQILCIVDRALQLRRGRQAVNDPVAVQAQAVAAGGRQIWRVRDENGWPIGRIQDPFAHPWEIGKPIGPGVGE